MSETRPAQTTPETTSYLDSAAHRRWVGWIFFAATLMLLVGFFQAIVGFVALFDDGYFVVTENRLLASMDYTMWGWIHLLLGLVAVVSGFGVMLAQLWARVIGIVMAVVSVFANVVFLAAYPIWSVAIIVLDVITIYALIVHGSEVEDAYDL
jgi:hypothetical protein